MSELMDKILAGKLKTRRDLAALPFDKKLDIMEKMRERSAILAENSLRKPRSIATPRVEVAGPGVALQESDELKKGLTPPNDHQLPD